MSSLKAEHPTTKRPILDIERRIWESCARQYAPGNLAILGEWTLCYLVITLMIRDTIMQKIKVDMENYYYFTTHTLLLLLYSS